MNIEAVRQLARVQFAFWIGEPWCYCSRCGHIYTSVDDMINRDPYYVGKDPLGKMILEDKMCHTT